MLKATPTIYCIHIDIARFDSIHIHFQLNKKRVRWGSLKLKQYQLSQQSSSYISYPKRAPNKVFAH